MASGQVGRPQGDSSASACAGLRDSLGRLTRRQALGVGTLAVSGLSLPALFSHRAQAATTQSLLGPQGGPIASGFGRARACILIFQWGGPSQLDTWDPKPDAPAEIRGEFAHDRDERAGRADQRALPPARRADAPPGDRPLDDPRRPGAPLDGPPRC